MAETVTIKKYLDQAGLETLVNKIKALDAATLRSANSYSDGLADNYDTAGSASTAESNAKKYADEQVKALSDGQVTTNKNAIAAIVADYLKTKDKTELQGAIDALKTFVGTLPESSTAASIVAYIDEKTAGIASDKALEALSGRVTTVEGKVQAIEDDYLVEADKTELSTAIATEKSRAEGIESGLRTDVDAIKSDYLKAADKTALAADIKTAQDTANAAKTHSEGVASDLATAKTALEAADTAQVGRIKTLEDKIVDLSGAMHFKGIVDNVPEDVSAYKEGDVIIVGDKEYVFNGTSFAEFGDVSAQAQAITGLTSRMDAAETDIDTLQTDLDAAEAALAKKAEQSALTAEITARTDADTALDTRLDAVEGKLGDGEGSVSNQIATAKQQAIDAAAADATTKANKALDDAKSYADGLNTAMDTRVDALETDAHTHANKALLDTYDQTNENIKDAVAKKHSHANADVIDGITAEDVAAWDAAEANAKKYADGLNSTMSDRVGAIDTRVTQNTEAIATKAAASDLTALAERVTTAEANITANTSAINSFARISEDDINAMFA